MRFHLLTAVHEETIDVVSEDDNIELNCWDYDDDQTSVGLDAAEAVMLADALYDAAGQTSNTDLVKASDLSVNDALIRIAALHGLRVSFRYAKGDSSPVETRQFVPASLKVYPDHTTFVGKDSDRSLAFRSFRTDRIKGTVAILGDA
jgi:predicted DNA-binding transcriptional regulator YafY